MVESVCAAWTAQKLSHMFCWWLWCFQEHCLLLVATLHLRAMIFLITFHVLEILLSLLCKDPIAHLGWAPPFRENSLNIDWFFRGVILHSYSPFWSHPSSSWYHIFPKHPKEPIFKALPTTSGPGLQKWPTYIGLPSYKNQLLTFMLSAFTSFDWKSKS